jgi:hypothetical protein
MRASTRTIAAVSVLLLPVALPAQSKYANKAYGISFEFPEGYKLHRGELGDSYSLGYLGPIPMEFPYPGGVRLATVEVPATLYPNTDFDAAFVTVSVNQYLTQGECDPPAPSLPKSQETLTLRIDGLEFHGTDEGDAGLGHQFGGTYYHSFFEGSCYELGEGIATSGYGSVEGLQKVDGAQVSASLNLILRSVRIDAVPDIKPLLSPSIRSFAMSPRLNSPTGAYHVLWDVNGADKEHVWLSVGCSGDLNIFEIADTTPNGHAVLCDVLLPAQSASGSLDLAFRNLSGGEVQETVRLFAKSRGAVSKAVTITLPPLPVVISVARYATYSAASEKPVQLFTGHEVDVLGVAFLSRQTVHIGATTLPVESTDGKNLRFTIPESMPEGQYSLYIENERGRSNPMTVQLVK